MTLRSVTGGRPRPLAPWVLWLLLAGAGWLPPPAPAAEPASLAASFYEKAVTAFDRGEYRVALIHLRNARQRDPSHLPARILLGRTYLRLGDGRAAASELEAALRQGADEALALVPYGEALLMQREYERLFEEIPLGGHPPALEARVRVLRGRALLAQRRVAEAQVMFEDAARLAPDAVEPLLAQAGLHLSRGDVALAEDLADLAVQVAPEDPQAWLLKAELRRRKGDRADALKALERAVELAPGNVRARTGRAALLIDLERYAKAEADLAWVLRARPNDPQANYLHALALARQGRMEEAQRAMNRSAQALASLGREYVGADPETLLLSGIIHFNQGSYAIAYQDLRRYVQLVPGNPVARKLLGSLALRQGRWEEARDVLEPALRTSPRDPELMALLGSAMMKARKFDRATELFRQAASLRPEAPDIQTQLALSRLAAGRRGEALALLEKVAGTGSGEAGLLIGFIHLRQGEYAQALEAARALIRMDAGNAAAHNLAGAALSALGRLAAARASFEEAIAVDPGNLAARYSLAQLALAAGRHDRARARYEEILTLAPGEIRAMSALATVAESQGRTDDAIAWLEKLRATDRGAISEQVRLVELYLAAGRAKEALQVAQEMRPSSRDTLPVLLAQGRAFLALGERKRAAAVFRDLSRLAGFEPGILYQVAQYQLAARDSQGARFSLAKAVEAAPDMLAAQAALVELDAREGRFQEAMDRAAALRERFPEQGTGWRLTGDLLMESGRYAEAVRAYEAGLAREPAGELAVRLYRARTRAGPDRKTALANALRGLEEWVSAHPGDPEARRALGAGYLEAGRLEAARRIHESLLADAPRDAGLLNNLALIYHRLGDPRALATARRAVELAPDAPPVLDTLGWILVRSGEPARGLRYLRSARARAASEPSVAYHLAVALARLGREDEARKELRRLVRARGADFREARDARALLERLGG